MKLADIQFAVLDGKIDQNRCTAERLIRQAADQGANLVCLPELFTTGHDFDSIRGSETFFPQISDWLSDMARSLKIYLVAGTIPEKVLGTVPEQVAGNIPEKKDGRFYNTAFFFNNSGELLGQYRKINLFPPMGEDTFFASGQDCPVFDTPLGRVGICICYDLRFPAQFADLAARGAQIILVPAQFPHPRLDHWRVLLRARAIDNRLFVAGCNCIGVSGQNWFCGHSCVISPWGETLVEAGEREGLAMAGIDLDQVKESRLQFQKVSDKILL